MPLLVKMTTMWFASGAVLKDEKIDLSRRSSDDML
jgi:hypothetical protein